MSLTLTNTAPLPMVSERGQGRACHRQHGERTLDAVQRPTQSKMAEGAAFDALSHDKQRHIIDTNSGGSVQVSVCAKAIRVMLGLPIAARLAGGAEQCCAADGGFRHVTNQ
jgi:hypothetical protein